MNIFETNSGLGYKEKAFLLETKHGFLCIGHQNIEDGDCGYFIGEIVSDMTDVFLEKTNFNLKDSKLWNKFLFQTFLKEL